jgi:pSer/pThr/pTyr-binding forkhead associated (FHA) protein
LDSHVIVVNGTKSMKVVLELQEQLANVRRVTVRHDIVIGRGSDCNLRLSAPQMSRRHCFLRVGRDGVSVTDLDSSNGTYVDNKRIKPGERVELVTGSILTLGPVNFIVHLKEDSGSPSKSEGERSRKSPKAASIASDSSTIVSSAAAIIAQESKAKAPLNYSVEQAGASAEAHELTARIKGEPVNEAFVTPPKRSSTAAKTGLEDVNIAGDTGKKAAAAAGVAAVAASIVEQPAEAKVVSSSPVAESTTRKIDADDVESPTSNSSWLTDDSPDDLSFFGGQGGDDLAAPVVGGQGSEVVDAVDEVAVVDDVVEEVVEVLDDDDIFAEEVVEAVVVEDPVDAVEMVEVLDEEPLEVVEVLEDETKANAITADLDESDLFAEELIEVLEEPDVLAEDIAAAELVEAIEEPDEVVEILDDDAPVEVLEAGSVESPPNEAELVEVLDESNDFFDQLGIVEDTPQSSLERIAGVDTAAPQEDPGVEVVDAEWFEEPVDVVEVVDNVASAEAAEMVSAEPDQNDAELLDVLDDSSDFFDSPGIDAEPVQTLENAAVAEAVVGEGLTESVAEVISETEVIEEPAEAAEVLEDDSVVELSEESSDFFDSLGLDIEPQQAVDDATTMASVGVTEESPETDWFSDAVEEVVDVVEEQPANAVVDEVEMFDDVELLDESRINENPMTGDDPQVDAIPAVTGSAPAWDDLELSEVAETAVQGEFDFLDEQEAVEASELIADAPKGTAVADTPAVDEPADVDAEIEVLEEFDFFDNIEVAEPMAPAEHVDAVEEFDAEVEEVELFEEVADGDVATADEEIVAEDVVEVAEEDEGSSWFDVGDDKGEDEDDPELRKFLKGF